MMEYMVTVMDTVKLEINKIQNKNNFILVYYMNNNILNDIFYNTKEGYINTTELYYKALKKGYKGTLKDVINWYNDQSVNQIYSKKSKSRTYRKIISHYNQIGELQGDLMDISKFYTHNSHYKYLFNVIDVYSRFCWSYPLKTKKPSEIEPYLKEIFDMIPENNHRAFTTDKGNEFKSTVLDTLAKLNVLVYVTDPDSINAKNTTALVERLNYTLWMKIKKYMYSNDTLKFVDVLPELIYNYNHTRHSTIRRTPASVFHGLEKPNILGLNIDTNQTYKYKIGDLVRYQLKRNIFTKKAYNPIYSLTTHKIINIKGNRYILDNNKEFLEEQLIKATEDTSTFKQKNDENDNQMKKERILKEEFKKPIEQIENQIVSSKRIKKAPVLYSKNVW